ncbi:zinc finger protein 287-like [Microplitis mediator]|uniref:zinc finger protein 287-like n=1 Tax=Microplitis mediator TaxID=375433 RepID=UPI002555A636|nr:zinc finger protein 287-like [Microplitis mediator]
MEMSSDLITSTDDNYLETLTGDECRLCLQKSKDSWPLFQSNNNQLPEKIMACAAVQIINGDGLPSTICSPCNRLLEISYNFKCAVEKTDAKLRATSHYKPLIVYTESLTQVSMGQTPEQNHHSKEERVLITDTLADSHLLQLNPDNTIIFSVDQVDELKPNLKNSLSTDSQVVLLEKLDEFDDPLEAKVQRNCSFTEVFELKENILAPDTDTDPHSDAHVDTNVDSHADKHDNESIKVEDEKTDDSNDKKSSKLISKHQNLMFICHICSEQFNCVDELKKHVTTHDSLKSSDDNLINNEQNILNNDENIEKKLDTDKKSLKYKCKHCNKQFTYEKSYLTHAKLHEETKTSSSRSQNQTQTQNSFSEDDDLTDDLNDDLPEGLQCLQCGKLFATKRNLKRHISTHTGVKFNCSTCRKEFSRLDKLKEHEYAKHVADFTDTDDNDDDDRTEGTKEGGKEIKKNRPHKCSLCPKAFAQLQSLNNHVERHKRVKDTQKRFLCDVCSKCFAQSGSLVAHMRTHTGVKPYVCNVCSRAFTKSTYLQLHLRTHSGEKPYICQYCSRAFARANTLARHITMHTGEAKYHCQICRKSFRRLTSLNEHTYTHTGQRPYACKICTKRYNNAGSLYAHTKKCKALNGAKEEVKDSTGDKEIYGKDGIFVMEQSKNLDNFGVDSESFEEDNKEFKGNFYNMYPSM